MEKTDILKRLRGSLVAGALGDALGYEVEFMYIEGIKRRFGAEGIRSCVVNKGLHGQQAALISDDTQMTLFTAAALARPVGDDLLQSIKLAYIEWYATQKGKLPGNPRFSLTTIPELNENRAPGGTCMQALRSIGNNEEPKNNSKGCGGVMRIAPVALYAAATGHLDAEGAARLAGEAARLTHKHILGYVPAAFTAYIIYKLVLDPKPDAESLRRYAAEGIDMVEAIYGYISDFRSIIENALMLEKSDMPDDALVEACGQGWVAEETAAIALVCALRHFDDINEALVMAANHDGDSDSTAAVCGNILGAAVGIEALDQAEVSKLELLPLILSTADSLAE